MTRLTSPSELKKLRKTILSNRDPQKPWITLCCGSACQATGSEDIAAGIEAEIEKQGFSADVSIRKTGCHGFCERGPIIVNHPDGSCYFQITPEDVPDIVTGAVKKKQIAERLLYTDPDTKEQIINESDIPFYKHQERLVFGSNGRIDPKSIDDYLAIGG